MSYYCFAQWLQLNGKNYRDKGVVFALTKADGLVADAAKPHEELARLSPSAEVKEILGVTTWGRIHQVFDPRKVVVGWTGVFGFLQDGGVNLRRGGDSSEVMPGPRLKQCVDQGAIFTEGDAWKPENVLSPILFSLFGKGPGFESLGTSNVE